MLTTPEIACAVLDGISSVREDEELQDFVVEVEGKEFKCHRLILSACSGFFRGLLRSGMKESKEQRTKLEGVSVETFTAILETLYTGSDNLTRDNMLNVWQAANQLQITFIFDNCVNFITNNVCNKNFISVWKVASLLMHKNIKELCESILGKNITLENWETLYSTANSLGSDLMLSHVRDLIRKNYEFVIKSNAFLCLCENDLRRIIQSQDLVVSCEDVVIESIFKWIKSERTNDSGTLLVGQNGSSDSIVVTQGANNNHTFHAGQFGLSGDVKANILAVPEFSNQNLTFFFESLLLKTRLCLVNSVTLENLSRDTLVMSNERAREMVMDALLYKSAGRQHGVWSKAAVHRSCSDLENVGVMGHRNGYFSACSFHPKFKWLAIPKCQYLARSTSVNMISYMTDFFAISDLTENSNLCFFVKNDWRHVKSISGHGWLGVAVEEFIYLINSSNQQIKRFDPRLGNCEIEDLIRFPSQHKIEHICSFDLFILAFCSYVVKGVEATAVYCLDTRSQTWSRLDSLAGSAKNVVTFRKEKQLYVLQTNGNLWEICSDRGASINVTWVEILWHGNYIAKGAISYNDVLFILGQECFSGTVLPVPLFSKIIVNDNQGYWSNIVPAILKKSIFANY